MEMAQEVDRLTRAGYLEDFKAEAGGLRATHSKRLLDPATLVVDEILRFEGETDPEDEAILLALRSRDGSVRGTWAVPYGPEATPEDEAMLQALSVVRSPRASG
ncbi:MAG: hypothetical protein D6729_07585 [Deltaproteobacteria bacterium]|nr:MAG: hypothetical protein D6729_07585 [Deltaproteobacteria bacterium]